MTDGNIAEELADLYAQKEKINFLIDSGDLPFAEESKQLQNLEAVCDQIESMEEIQAEEMAEMAFGFN
jgi:hypothetical protein